MLQFEKNDVHRPSGASLQVNVRMVELATNLGDELSLAKVGFESGVELGVEQKVLQGRQCKFRKQLNESQ